MATLITKNSSTASSVPTNAQLVQGELAVNVTDKRLYTENASGTVVELGTNPGSAVTHTAGTAGAPAITTTGDTNTGLFFPAADTVAASVGGTEGLRLTSTGLGVGTSSPAAKLQVGDGTATTEIRIDGDGGSGNGGFIRGYKDTANPSWFVGDLNPIAGGANSGLCLYSYGATPQVFYTNGSERLRLDSSGNLGLGVTPSAWATNSRVLQVINSSLETRTDNPSYSTVVANGYINTSSSWRYVSTDYASRYTQFQGQHLWFNAPSGTAGNAISFTQAMTLDASGRLGVGTTSPATAYRMSLTGDGSAMVGGLALTSGGNTAYIGQVGATSADCEYWNAANGYVRIGTNNTERARITSGGDLLVGTTSSIYGERFTLSQPNAGKNTSVERNTSATPFGIFLEYSTASPNGTGNYFINCTDSTALRFEARSNGGLANYSANNVNLSDRREKTNFAPAKDYLDTICAIPVQTFNYIDQSEDDPGLTLGVVAQDVQAVAPELVSESNWGTKEDPKMRLSIYQTDLQYALMKALQELNAKVQSLTTELNALKGT